MPEQAGTLQSTQPDDRMLAKVRALLAKAEATTFQEEAEAFTAKAHALMAEYAIEQALVDGFEHTGAPEAAEVQIPDPYAKAKFILLSAVAGPNRCRAIFHSRPEGKTATLVGFSSDLEAVEMLYTSLLLQATHLMTTTGPVTDFAGRSRTKSYRNSFLQGFAYAIGERFEENRLVAESAAVEAHGGTALPVLADRADRVDDTVQELFPRLGTLQGSVSNGGGLRAGHRAGVRADLGAARVGGTRRSLRP